MMFAEPDVIKRIRSIICTASAWLKGMGVVKSYIIVLISVFIIPLNVRSQFYLINVRTALACPAIVLESQGCTSLS